MARLIRHNPISVWPVPATFRDIYTHAVEVPAGARLLLVSGQIGVGRDGTALLGFAEQCEQAMSNIEALLSAATMEPCDIIKVIYYLTRADDLAMLSEIRRRRWSAKDPPAVTTLVVAALARPELLVEIEVLAAAANKDTGG